jgi:hypothetical protein
MINSLFIREMKLKAESYVYILTGVVKIRKPALAILRIMGKWMS